MDNLNIPLKNGESFPLIFVEGTKGTPFLFATRNGPQEINVDDFYISQYTVTQTFWEQIMGTNPSYFKGDKRPVECVSFTDITKENGFLPGLNTSHFIKDMAEFSFRLPTETEWEYAAKGGKHWKDNFIFSGSNDLNAVGWYELNSGKYTDPEIISKLKNADKETSTHDVGLKAPNQLGIYDMCGNVWEWCHDYFVRDTNLIPKDGSPNLVKSKDRALKGGCHHNGAIHCSSSQRYEIAPDCKDACIGFRIVFSKNKYPLN